jgi:hypothetical protein
MTPRAHKSSVSGTHYVMHLPRPGYVIFVWCGRKRATVNSYADGYVSPYAPEEEEQTCLACIKARDFAGESLPPPAPVDFREKALAFVEAHDEINPNGALFLTSVEEVRGHWVKLGGYAEDGEGSDQRVEYWYDFRVDPPDLYGPGKDPPARVRNT